MKKWIADKLVPPPVYEDTAFGYLHYTREELQIIAKQLSEHFEVYDYLHHTHTPTINRVWQAVESYRKQHRR